MMFLQTNRKGVTDLIKQVYMYSFLKKILKMKSISTVLTATILHNRNTLKHFVKVQNAIKLCYYVHNIQNE